jgi:hypothetical protein
MKRDMVLVRQILLEIAEKGTPMGWANLDIL